MEPVTCPNPACPSGGSVGVIIAPLLLPGEPLLCPQCQQPLALTPDQTLRAAKP